MAVVKFPEEERFWDKVLMPTVEGACWPWTGSLDTSGYGTFRLTRGPLVKATRWVLARKIGRDVTGFALHSCDNPQCVNPEHIREGTPKENSQDCLNRGRYKNWENDKTHCPAEHEYVAENMRPNRPNGWRDCKICAREKQRARRQAATEMRKDGS